MIPIGISIYRGNPSLFLLIRCANSYNRKKRCANKAVYRQNPYVELCADCFGEITDNMFKVWFKWVELKRENPDLRNPEPPIWIYDSEKIIRG